MGLGQGLETRAARVKGTVRWNEEINKGGGRKSRELCQVRLQVIIRDGVQRQPTDVKHERSKKKVARNSKKYINWAC